MDEWLNVSFDDIEIKFYVNFEFFNFQFIQMIIFSQSIKNYQSNKDQFEIEAYDAENNIILHY